MSDDFLEATHKLEIGIGDPSHSSVAARDDGGPLGTHLVDKYECADGVEEATHFFVRHSRRHPDTRIDVIVNLDPRDVTWAEVLHQDSYALR